MATLRDLREQARSMVPPVEYSKTTTKEELEEMIAERLAADAEKAPFDTDPEPVHAVEPPSAEVSATEAPANETVLDIPDPVKPSVGELTFATDITINEGDLNKEFIEQPSKFLKYAVTEAQAQALVLKAKFILETTEAEVASTIREDYRRRDLKLTEKQLESEVLKNSKYQHVMKEYLKAKEQADILRAARDAFTQRKDMLVQLGLARRQESEHSTMAIKEKVKEIVGSGRRTPVVSSEAA